MSMVKKDERVLWTDEDFIDIELKGRTVRIHGTGVTQVSNGNSGYWVDLFEKEKDPAVDSLITALNSAADSPDFTDKCCSARKTDYEQTDSQKTADYLYLLVELQKAGHDCHAEINEMLKKIRKDLFNE